MSHQLQRLRDADAGSVRSAVHPHLGPMRIACALAVLGIVTTAVVAYRELSTARETTQLAMHAQNVRREITALLSAVQDHESGMRGYLITGDERFFDQVRAGGERIDPIFEALRRSVSDNPSQQARLARLKPLLIAKRNFDEQQIELRQRGEVDAAAAAIASGRGRQLLGFVRTLVAEIGDEEERLLGERVTALRGEQTNAVWLFGLLSVLAVIGLLVAYVVVARYLRQRQVALERAAAARAFAERVIDTVREPLLVLDGALRVESANRSYYRGFGGTPAHTLGRALDEVPGPWTGAELRPLVERVLETGAPFDDVEVAYGARTLLLNGRRLDADTSGAPAVLLAIEDITARRRAEALEIERRALQQTTAELQDFAYVASHDLQEPLRKIQAFAERLISKHEAALPADARDYLHRMQKGAERMQTLIDDLLRYSRVTTRAEPFAPVDLAAIAREVVGDLEVRIERSQGTVELGELPVVHADPTQMRQLLQNLIGNALKFHRPGEPPHVRVTGTVRNGRCALQVADNGIGFDEKYLDRIFTIFQRLHGRHDYEGTGLGLAICRKIVERHGGTITARSAPGAGATFIVTLPVDPAAQEAA